MRKRYWKNKYFGQKYGKSPGRITQNGYGGDGERTTRNLKNEY
jgi:hypothetical protein